MSLLFSMIKLITRGKKIHYFTKCAFFLSCLALVACRGEKSDKPPIMPIQNMVDQSSYGPQSKNDFYADHRAARPAVKHTVEQGQEKLNSRFYLGQEIGDIKQPPVWVKDFPLALNLKILKNGQVKYNIYCAPCHGYAGHSDGLVVQHALGTIQPAKIHDKTQINLPVGQIFNVVSNGVNKWNMPGFKEQMDASERWAVVAYVRALQLSQQASANDVPKNLRVQLDGAK